ncbi:MAG TPA: hypothetical protein VFW27_15080, partial [Actinoplanes sp.]|nr:hypothetical protein [Actinoplanes sp.]
MAWAVARPPAGRISGSASPCTTRAGRRRRRSIGRRSAADTIAADTSYWLLGADLFLMGLGMGFTMMP